MMFNMLCYNKFVEMIYLVFVGMILQLFSKQDQLQRVL